ncbi:hypothetical protein CTheo_7847 [Ceratobasidium theobromae]|uniref:Uncharacterized protein n=1 Tax=Ceratobasidium theobromae TaxID=1582974 RepID=A0A5N5QAB4_9AGAM|nr:hypothetical protein CTheo_7847 [Ceratobasidium theobromae]
MSNLHGSIFALRAVLKPGLLVPHIKVDTISRLDFAALKKAGYTGVVVDRDNCLDAWAQCKSSFGRDNVLVVSNSAGASDDPLGIQQAESLTYNLGAPVLRHSLKKPVCSEEILRYFRDKRLDEIAPISKPRPAARIANPNPPSLNDPLDLVPEATSVPPSQPTLPQDSPKPLQRPPSPPPRLVVIGDRLLTDVLLSNTLPSPPTHLAIWTTRLWKTPDLGFLRYLERSALRLVLWQRNQTFRHGVIERRARGETWLGREGWMWWIRRWALRAVRRGEPVPLEPVPPRTNELAKFVLPEPVVVPGPPTTRLGWAWYYSKIGAWYAAKGGWVVLVWTLIRARQAAVKGWAWGTRKIREARASRAEKQLESQSVQEKSS